MIHSGILVLPCPYRCMMSIGIMPMMLADFAFLLWSPARYAVKTLYLLLREKLHLSSPQKLPVSYVFLQSAVHYLPVYWIISWCPMCRLLQTSNSANFLLKIQATWMSMSITLVFWDVHTKFGITRNGTCDQILYLNSSIQLRIHVFSI